MRLLLSFSAEHRCTMRKIDVKSAYLQAKGFTRNIFVRQQREESNVGGLRKLFVPSYDLPNSSRLCYLTSYEALTTHYGFKQSKLDPSPCTHRTENDTHLLLVQVNDYLYAVLSQLALSFEKILHDRFQIGSMKHILFTIMGVHLTQDKTGNITINA